MKVELKAAKIKQICEVCDEEGTFNLGRILIIGMPLKYERPVGQCPACKRFFCAKHAEGIATELNHEELSQLSNVIKSGDHEPRLLCCPLDLGVPLGKPDENRVVIVSSEVKRVSADWNVRRDKEPNKFRTFVNRLKGIVRKK